MGRLPQFAEWSSAEAVREISLSNKEGRVVFQRPGPFNACTDNGCDGIGQMQIVLEKWLLHWAAVWVQNPQAFRGVHNSTQGRGHAPPLNSTRSFFALIGAALAYRRLGLVPIPVIFRPQNVLVPRALIVARSMARLTDGTREDWMAFLRRAVRRAHRGRFVCIVNFDGSRPCGPDHLSRSQAGSSWSLSNCRAFQPI